MSRVKVKRIQGMFSQQSLITINTMSGPLEIFVDDFHLIGDELCVEFINNDDVQALVKLPVEPPWGGKNVVVRLEDLVKD